MVGEDGGGNPASYPILPSASSANSFPLFVSRHKALALLFEGGKTCDIEHEAAPRQLGGHSRQIAAQQLRIEHGEFLELPKPDIILMRRASAFRPRLETHSIAALGRRSRSR